MLYFAFKIIDHNHIANSGLLKIQHIVSFPQIVELWCKISYGSTGIRQAKTQAWTYFLLAFKSIIRH